MKLRSGININVNRCISCIALAILLFVYIFQNTAFELVLLSEEISKTKHFANVNLNNVTQNLNENIARRQELESNKSETFLEMVEIEKNITATTAAIYEASLIVSGIETKLNNEKNKLFVIETKYKEKENQAKKRLKIIYKNGKLNNLKIILKSKNILEAISTYYMLEYIGALDRKMLENIKNERNEVKKISDDIKVLETEMKKEYENLIRMKELNENYMILKNSKFQKLSEDEKKVIEEIEKLEKEKLIIEEEIAKQLLVVQKLPKYVGGVFAWPVPSVGTNLITARFRQAGSSWSTGLHSGVDIAIPRSTVGSAVGVAAGEGRVIVAVSNKNGSRVSYGNYVMIDHGGNIYTLYGHAEKVLVEVRTICK